MCLRFAAVLSALAMMTTVSSNALAQKPAATTAPAPIHILEAYGMKSPLSLAQFPLVQQEINVTDEQIPKLKKLHYEMWDEFNLMRKANEIPKDLPADERFDKRNELENQLGRKVIALYRPKAAKILDAKQIERLDQISIQGAFEMAYWHPTVVEALKLSQDQQDQIASINQKYHEEMKAMGGLRGAGGNLGGRIVKARELQQTRMKHLDEVLTDDQRAQFEKMKGPPFDVLSLYRR